MHPHLSRRRLACLLAGGALLLLAPSALAAVKSITLDLKGGYKNQSRVACTQRNHYTVYHRGGTLRMEGYISPAPALLDGTWRVKIKVKRCKGGRFVEIWDGHARGNGGGNNRSRRLQGPGASGGNLHSGGECCWLQDGAANRNPRCRWTRHVGGFHT